MRLLTEHEKVLINRLAMKGLEQNEIPGFIWSLKSCLMDNPDMNHLQANDRLPFLGWNGFKLDYHTLQLAISCFEVGVFKETERLMAS